jgi:hypothetical protein
MSVTTTVEWPSYCDLCEEYTTTPERCSHCGHRLRPIERSQGSAAPTRAFERVPLDQAAAELRRAHRAVLAELAAWALAQGRPVDLDVAALCLQALERERGDDGLRLDRSCVNGIMCGAVRNEATLLHTTLPETWIEDLWIVLRFCVGTGRLTEDSDPEPVLLEPLQCYGGLGADGRPRPDGVDVDFFCQCYLPHDPECPPGMVQISVGRNWGDLDDLFEYVALGHGVPRSVDVPVSAFGPLAKLARRARAQRSMFPFFLDLFDHVGTLPADRKVPQLWVYRFTGSHRKGWPPLALDEHGGAWCAVRHRGRRRGFRWKPMGDRSAAHHCGVASWDFDRAHRELERRDEWDDWDDEMFGSETDDGL